MERKGLVSIFAVTLGLLAILTVLFIIKNKTFTAPILAKQSNKIKILIVPGHEPNDGGAIYKGIKERDLNVQLAQIVKDRLSKNTNLEVIVARDENGWNKDLQTYMESNSAQII